MSGWNFPEGSGRQAAAKARKAWPTAKEEKVYTNNWSKFISLEEQDSI